MSKKQKKQLKDKEHTEAKIVISRIRGVFKDRNATKFKNKLICIKISHPWGLERSTCFKDTKKGRKELLKFIEKELYL